LEAVVKVKAVKAVDFHIVSPASPAYLYMASGRASGQNCSCYLKVLLCRSACPSL